MLRFIRKNIFICSYLFFVVLFCVINLKTFSNEHIEKYRGDDNNYRFVCNKFLSSDNVERGKLINEYVGTYELNDKICNEIVSEDVKSVSFFLAYDVMLSNEFASLIIPLFVPLFILLPVVYFISKEFKSGNIKNYLLRKSYKSYLINLYKKSYSFIFPLLIMIGIFIIVSLNASNFNFNPTIDIGHSYLLNGVYDLYNNKYFMIEYIIIIIANVGLYINIGLIILSKNKNFFISLVESYVIVYLLWSFSIIVVGMFFQNHFNISADNFNLMSVYSWSEISSSKTFLLVNIIYYIISLVISLMVYKNREKIVKLCEE